MAIKIEITIPVLNEEKTIDRQIRKMTAHIKDSLSLFNDVRLIIADNGSTDRTLEIAERLSSELDNVSCISVGERGVGRALKASWSASAADIIGYMDLDLATDLQHLQNALIPLAEDKADVVTGSRLVSGSHVQGRKITRAISTRAFNFMLKTYFGVHFTDGMCGFKFLKKSNLQNILNAGALSDGWFFCTEVLICAEHLGLRVKELPVTWTDDPKSKVRIFKLAWEYINDMRALKHRIRTAVYD